MGCAPAVRRIVGINIAITDRNGYAVSAFATFNVAFMVANVDNVVGAAAKLLRGQMHGFRMRFTLRYVVRAYHTVWVELQLFHDWRGIELRFIGGDTPSKVVFTDKRQ